MKKNQPYRYYFVTYVCFSERFKSRLPVKEVIKRIQIEAGKLKAIPKWRIENEDTILFQEYKLSDFRERS